MIVLPSKSSMVKVFWIFLILVFCLNFSQAAQPTLQALVTNGPPETRINVVVLAEGYQSGETSKFVQDARKVVADWWQTSPYTEYSNFFNVYLIFTPSVDSGSDHPSRNIYRNTYFNSTYDSYGLDRLITIPPNDSDLLYSDGQGKVDALLKQLMPQYDLAMMIVNDPEYGGSGGQVPITSVDYYAPAVLVHELGHTLGDLGDEYDTEAPSSSTESANTTQETRRDYIRWTRWISPNTPVPTPKTTTYAKAIGLFEGAAYHATGWYRPKQTCRMRSLLDPFCEVCQEALVLSTYRLLRPIEESNPVATNLVVSNAPVALSLGVMEPASHNLHIQWSVNGVVVPGTNSLEMSIGPAFLPKQSNTIQVEVRDGTGLVRNDPTNLLAEVRTWQMTMAGAPAKPTVFFENPTLSEKGVFTSLLRGTYNQGFVIQYSPDFHQWLALETNLLAGGVFEFIHNRVGARQDRIYYRAQLHP